MKKKILILHVNMEPGGAESSLLGLLSAIDYDRYDVDLFLYAREGALLPLIPESVRVLPEISAYRQLTLPIGRNFAEGFCGIGAARCFARVRSACAKGPLHSGHNYKQYFHRLCIPFLPEIPGKYDLAISFNDPHYIIGRRVSAKVKMAWFHTDASRMAFCPGLEREMWEMADYAVTVSAACKAAFDRKHPYLAERSMVIENILSRQLVLRRSEEADVSGEMRADGNLRLLSVGRFSDAKNFGNVPDICRRILALGCSIRWYLIGFGAEEGLIRRRIAQAGMENRVILIGRRENPYPYIRACDLYVQPSRYEGKSVAVREAQMLGKAVVITRYPTAESQLEDGVDGVIVPMDNAGCARAIASVIRDGALRQRLAETAGGRDYTNAREIEKIYGVLENL